MTEPNKTYPMRHGLSNSGIDRCPVCDSDLYIFKEGMVCMANTKHYNVSHEQYREDQERGRLNARWLSLDPG